MRRLSSAIEGFHPALIILFAASFAAAQTPSPTSTRPHIGHPVRADLEDVLSRFRLASFAGTDQDSIQATATDSSGNVYVAGTTYSAQLPVKNAEQSEFGDASILQTSDQGTTWTPVNAPPGGATTLAVDPASPQVLFASTPSGIFESANSGQTWQSIYSLSAYELAIDPGNHLHIAAITRSGALIRSLDGGSTWGAGGPACGVGETCRLGQLIADPTGSGTLLVLSAGFATISRDWGLTFQPVSIGIGLIAPAFDPSHPGWIYASNPIGIAGSVYLSTDYGTTWTEKGAPKYAVSAMAVDPNQPDTLVAIALNGVYKSTDGAASWTLQQPTSEPSFDPAFMQPVLLVPHSCNSTGGIFAIGNAVSGSYSVSFSADFGITWKTPQYSGVSTLTSGGGCIVYITRTISSDAFAAKIGPDGTILWATYLGGSDQDAAVALAVDSQGNTYIAGDTLSPDFPTTVPHIGTKGENSVFLTKLSSEGAVIYSATLGGEANNTLTSFAIDSSQNAYLVGNTNSLQFPVTSGTIDTSLQPESSSSFLAKLSSAGTLSYATYLGASYTFADAILLDADVDVILAGSGIIPGVSPPPGETPDFILKLDKAASKVLASQYLPSQFGTITGLASDSQNNILLLGQTTTGTLPATPGAFSSPQPTVGCDLFGVPNDAYVAKLNASNWQTIYTAVFTATCGIETGSISIDGTGAAVLALAATGNLALHDPLVAGPVSGFTSAVAKLSADGSTLQFATYLDYSGIPALAFAPDGSLYAGVAALPTGTGTAVLHLKTTNPGAVSINSVSNAFSGDENAVVFGGLYSISISGLQPASANLGLNPSSNLPTELSGVQVLFNGAPAPILATSPGQILVAAPARVAEGPELQTNRNYFPTLTSVRVIENGVASNPVWMPVSQLLPGLLTVDYPNTPPPASAFPDALALNQDGTQNSTANPAAAGSTISLYATGLGGTVPFIAPGSIAQSTAVSPALPVYSPWIGIAPGVVVSPLTVTSMPGFISDIFQVQLQIPAGLTGTDVGNNVSRIQIGLVTNVAPVPFPASNVVGVYVKNQ